MDDTFPEGSLLKVSFELRLPVAATQEQVEEWIQYAVCQTGGCSMDNPLVHHGPNAWGSSFDWEDTGMIGTREEFNHWSKPDGSRGCTVRHRRERRAA